MGLIRTIDRLQRLFTWSRQNTPKFIFEPAFPKSLHLLLTHMQWRAQGMCTDQSDKIWLLEGTVHYCDRGVVQEEPWNPAQHTA